MYLARNGAPHLGALRAVPHMSGLGTTLAGAYYPCISSPPDGF